jgi:hypothetical protein
MMEMPVLPLRVEQESQVNSGQVLPKGVWRQPRGGDQSSSVVVNGIAACRIGDPQWGKLQDADLIGQPK